MKLAATVAMLILIGAVPSFAGGSSKPKPSTSIEPWHRTGGAKASPQFPRTTSALAPTATSSR